MYKFSHDRMIWNKGNFTSTCNSQCLLGPLCYKLCFHLMEKICKCIKNIGV